MFYKSIVLGLSFLTAVSSFAQTPCEAGQAAGYPCQNVDLISIFTLAEMGSTGAESNDIWGWTDPLDGKEYVIFGTTQGTTFIDISDPVNPIFIGELPTATSNSLWRDMKVFANHAFIVSEAGGHGMQVFDLTRLRNPGTLPAAFTADAQYNGFGNCHNIAINEETGYAYCVGANVAAGGLHILDINDPTNPTLAGDFALDGYTHDCQAVVYNGPDADHAGKEIVFACNEDTFTIVDVNDKTDTQQISRTGYTGVVYSHQGWLTEDQRYFLLDDELDESNNNHNTRTYIWDVQDLDNPINLGFYTSSESAIDHNMYIKGNLAYQANYRSGLRILDVTDVASNSLSEVAFFDVYPASNSANFNGAWSNYPYFESGVIAVSHIEEGLFLLKPTFFSINPSSTTVCAADVVTIDLTTIAGFAGPVNFTVSGQPASTNVAFSANGVNSPSSTQLTMSDFPASGGTYTIEIVAAGSEYTYKETLSLTVEPSEVFFADSDGDGFGDTNTSVSACAQPTGFVTDNTDCDDANANKYPGAPGTSEGVDNNCDGNVTGDEEGGCPADLNSDGAINGSDLVLVIAEFGCDTDCLYDINNDGFTNSPDLVVLIGVLGSGCP